LQTVTPTETATPSATAQATETSTPTVTVEATSESPNCLPAGSVFADAWVQLFDEIGCASGQVFSGQVVEENFAGGKMVWREPLDFAQAMVLFNNGTFRIFQHPPYSEGDPEYPCTDAGTPAQSPPTPRRGFGAMWCNIPEIRSGLGNATDAERSYLSAMQRFENGSMLRTDSGGIYVFYDSGEWERR
jgi:hypothetical protein